ncbi:MAG: RNA 2',3'-cyclic phosphodiesterase [Thermoplasmata archaeon]|nr:RNA 2',3'-cyclic phosphodiesterase [Thermoplasmata archaeon]
MRCFIAIEVPFTKSMEELQRSIEGRVKLVERENVHITLKFLGEIREEMVTKIRDIIESCKGKSFTITLKDVGFFPNPRYVRVIWIGVAPAEPIVKLSKCIDEKLSLLGFEKEKSYIPHLTIARAKGPVSIKNLERFKGTKFGEVEVKEIKIKKSTLTPKGPIYKDLASIQL